MKRYTYTQKYLALMLKRTRLNSRVTTFIHRQLTLSASLSTAFLRYFSAVNGHYSVTTYYKFNRKLQDVFMSLSLNASHQPAIFCKFSSDTTSSFLRLYCLFETYSIISSVFYSVNRISLESSNLSCNKSFYPYLFTINLTIA